MLFRSLLGRAVECTKSSLGLKLFLNLAVSGEEGLARHVEVLHERAQAAHQAIHARSGFATACAPESNIVLGRVVQAAVAGLGREP